MSAIVISIIVLYAGITSFQESVKAIINPEPADYSTVMLVIVAVAVIFKVALSQFFINTGKKVSSESLVASGTEARFDAIISVATLVAALIFILSGISLESWLAAIISLVLIKSGFEMLRDTVSQILGERISADTSQAVKKTILSVEGVEGAYDLLFSDYGPDRVLASVHIEIPDTYTADKIDVITRDITQKVYVEHHISIVSVGVYSINTKDSKVAAFRAEVSRIASLHNEVLQMHGLSRILLYQNYNALWKNFCISDTYEPGSVAKPFTVATGLESGSITGNEVYSCPGFLHVGDYDIKCHNRNGDGYVSVERGIEISCNVAMMYIGQSIGVNTFSEFQRIFGFGLKTNIDLAGEARTEGLTYSASDMGPTDLAVNTFGQGFNVDMIEMISAYCSLINGGYFYEPHVVKKIVNSSGATVKNIEPRILRQTVSQSTSDKIRQYCEAVVME